MSFLKFLIPVITVLSMVNNCQAAVQCSGVATNTCGLNKHAQTHKLPTSVGSTYYAEGFHGGTMYAKFQSAVQSFTDSSEYYDLTYNFNLGDYDGTYWVALPLVFGEDPECFAVYKNCDKTILAWPLKTYESPTSYLLE